ncbi:MAG: helix-turn-helix domain-containing protein [Trichlorobacter sp.]|nr:helix-turn-helix domain-containing protein [Trichlorobacter sp.]
MKTEPAEPRAIATINIDECLARLMEGFKVKSINRLAARLDVTPQAIHSLRMRKDGYFPVRYMMEWCAETNGSLDYLLFGKGGLSHTNLKELTSEIPDCPVNFSKDWFKSRGMEIDEQSTRYLLGSSVSSGKAVHSDVFLVDTKAKMTDGLLVLEMNEKIMLREIRLRIDGKVEIDNEVIDEETKKGINVLGRVIWKGTSLI